MVLTMFRAGSQMNLKLRRVELSLVKCLYYIAKQLWPPYAFTLGKGPGLEYYSGHLCEINCSKELLRCMYFHKTGEEMINLRDIVSLTSKTYRALS